MELDDLKLAVSNFDRRLERVRALNLDAHKERKVDRVRASLRPLAWGHAAQVALGILVAFTIGPVWWNHLAERNLMIAGVLLYAYAVVMIALGARVLVLIYTLDLSGPVLAIQKSLTRLRRSYVTTSLIVGLPWWLLWMPLLTVLSGSDLSANAPAAWLIGNVVIGVVGILAMLWFYRALWYRSADPVRVRKLEEGAAGRSVRNAQRFLDEIAEFERE